MLKTKHIIYRILGVLLVIIIINIISSSLFLRIDFTADKRFTLDRATRRILKEVETPIIVTLYVSKDLPPNIDRTVQEMRDLLTEYNQYSNNNIEFEYVNPNKNEETELEARNAGIEPIPIEIREKDEVKIQRVFLGMVIQVGNRSETIPIIKPGIAMEYTLSTLIKKLTVTQKADVGYIWGHGEPEYPQILQLLQEINIQYNIPKVNLNNEPDLSKFKTLMIVAPTKQFSTSDFNRLDSYLAQGGNLMIAINRVNGILADGVGVTQNTGLEKWLLQKGLNIQDDFILDKKCGTVTVQRSGLVNYSQQINFPYIPIISNFGRHSITDGIETIALQFASPISYCGDTTKHFTPLAFTSNISGKVKAPISFDITKVWRTSDFMHPNLTVAAALQGKFGGTKDAKMCIIGDGDFVINASAAKNFNIHQDNINFFANAVDWLSDDSGLISLRTKGISSRPLNELSDRNVFLIKYLNLLLPIFIVCVYAFIKFQIRRKKRLKRMQSGYIE